MKHHFDTQVRSVASTATVLVALAILVVVSLGPQQAAAQYTFVPEKTTWGQPVSWTGGSPGTFPNAIDATVTFDLPLKSTANFTMQMTNNIPSPGTITIGKMTINNMEGNTYNTSFGGGNPGHLVFQTVSGSAEYTESAGTSAGSTTINSIITLASDLVVTQNHVDSDNLNSGTTFSGLINAASEIKLIKEGNANLSLTYAGTPVAGEGFFGSFEINQGAVRIVSNALLQNAAGVTVKSGAQLQVGISASQTLNLAEGASLSLQGGGVVGGPSNNEGALRFQMNGGVIATFASPIVLGTLSSGDNIINVQTNGSTSGTAVAQLSGPISGVAGDNGFLKTGNGNLYLMGADSNTYSGGTAVLTGALYLNKAAGKTAVPGNLNVGGSSLVVVQGDEQVADTGLVRFTSTAQYGGTLRLGNLNRQETVGGIISTNGQSGTIESNYNGASPSVATLTVAGLYTSQFNGLIRDTGYDPNTFIGKLAIAKTGAESLTLTNNNLYTGGTTISGGAFIADNTRDQFTPDGSATGTGPVQISGGTLAGRGYVTGATTVASTGRVAPGLISGTTTGILTLADTTFNGGAFLDIELGGTTFIPDGQVDYDRLVVDNTGVGTATLAGTLNVTLVNNFMPALDDTFQILTAATARTGKFDTEFLPALTGGNTWEVNNESNYVELKVVAGSAGTWGDFNDDGTVDAADYVTWRKNDIANASLPHDNGATNQAARYLLWRGEFGKPLGSGSSLGQVAIPEPATLLLASLAMFGCLASLRKR